MLWGKQADYSKFIHHPVEEGVRTSCMIPVEEEMRLRVQVSCEKPVDVLLITPEGESSVLLAHGRTVDWSGRVALGGVEIAADTSFWYLCHKSRVFELVDPTPKVIELTQTSSDVLRSMIDERLRAWKVQQQLERELTEDEKDELVLDIVNGDLEFDDRPDEFGLGYEERLQDFIAKQKEREEPPEEAPPAASSVVEPVSVPLAADKNSSST